MSSIMCWVRPWSSEKATTAFGLIVAIPALVAFSLLQGRTQHMIDDINETAVGVLNLIVANKEKMKMPAGQ